MTKPNETWTVLPHGPLTKVAEDLYTVVGKLEMPLGETTRRMSVVRLRESQLLIYSAIALHPTEMRKLEALGTPAFLVVPSDIHRLDAKAWKARYPAMQVIAPRGARDKVSKIVPVDLTDLPFVSERASLDVVPGTSEQEFAMTVRTETGVTLVVNDLIFNLPRIPGFSGAMLRLLGFAPGRPSMPKLVMKKLVKDREAVRAQLESWASMRGLERILVAHGGVIDQPQGTLRELAGALS
ncbi:MAG TPA: hypothetical protein VFZ61_16180 [Polyangiales bacterium]